MTTPIPTLTPVPTVRSLDMDLIDSTEQWLVAREGWRHHYSETWDTRARVDPVQVTTLWPDAEVVQEVGKRGQTEHILRTERALWYVRLNRTDKVVTVRSHAMSLTDAKAIVDAVRAILPKPARKSQTGVNVRFWYLSQNGPQLHQRVLETPPWETIRGNYAPDASDRLSRLMDGFRPSRGGQILLWHGLPGTGKTYALRSLLWQWRHWCSAEYILDPENLFGGRPAYLMEMLLSHDSDLPRPVDGTPTPKGERWKLLILEDTGELVSEDAKQRSGPGLSRLLNLTDGFLGQGLRVIVMITTNEEVRRLHPAVSRPGRAASVVWFAPLPDAQARAWVAGHGGNPADVKGESPLADLYALVERFGDNQQPKRKTPGFRPPDVLTTRAG